MPGESVPTVEAANALVLPAPPPAEPAAHLFMGPNVEYAGWWRRVGAWVIDAMIIGISSNLVTVVLGSTGSVLLVVAGLLIGFGATFAYYIILNAVGNRTIGRKVLGTKVVRDGGGDLTYGLSALRFMSTTVSWVTMFLGILWPLWDDKNQTFHDKIALTVVVRV